MPYLLILLPWAWFLGAHISDYAPLILFATILIHRHFPKNQPYYSFKNEAWFVFPLITFLVFYPVLLFCHHVAATHLGRHGVDFSIFAQVVHNIGHTGSPMSSLASAHPQNFMTHHFVPLLFIPGLFVYLGMTAPTALAVFHTLSFAAAIAAFFSFARYLKFSLLTSILVTTILFCNPTIRHTIFFEVHDEVFALPWIITAWWMWRKQKWFWMTAALIISSLAKESMFAMIAGFGLMTWIDRQINHGGNEHERKSERHAPPVLSLAITLYGILGFFGYAFLQPFILGKSFDHADKLASVSDLIRGDWLFQKATWTGFLLLPGLVIPLTKRKFLHFLLPALPLVGIIWLSRFPEMWKTMNYYGAVPTLILGLATLDITAKIDWIPRSTVIAIFIACMSLNFWFSERKPIRLVKEAINTPSFTVEDFEFIPNDARVIATPAAIPFLLRIPQLRRLGFHDTDNFSFEYIVTLPEEADHNLFSKELLEASVICHSNSRWAIRCVNH